jgi:sarcosine oxidase subunit alpha
VLGAAILAELSQRSQATVGVSRTRAPFQPATLATLCGDRRGMALRPVRRTPLHDWHAGHGAELEPMGLWMRPRFYRQNGSDAFKAGIHEAARVRAHGGIVDGSTLGKIEVCGTDAAAFLDRIYLTKASRLRNGRSKYMALLREDGMVLDDGIVLRLADDRFVATVSSGHAGHVLSHMEFWRDLEFADRHVTLTDVTEAWSVIVVAGPQSSDALRRTLGVEWQAPLANLTHMDFARGQWRERELRVLRASFSGERAFELHCRPANAIPLWEALVAAGLMPYGLEAMDVLRVEKGYLVSAEMNGQTTPQDLGLDGMLKLGNACVGRELLERPGLLDPQRPRLVGLRAADGKSIFHAGAQLTLPEEQRRACGHVTSAVYSPALGQWIALGLVSRQMAVGAELIARDPVRERETLVRVVMPVHLDPAGERMK